MSVNKQYTAREVRERERPSGKALFHKVRKHLGPVAPTTAIKGCTAPQIPAAEKQQNVSGDRQAYDANNCRVNAEIEVKVTNGLQRCEVLPPQRLLSGELEFNKMFVAITFVLFT